MDEWERTYIGETVPVGSIDDADIVEVVAKGLAPLIGAEDSEVDSVRAQLEVMADMNSYVCLWMQQRLGEPTIERLKKAYPDLFPLVADSKGESQINAYVYARLGKLRRQFGRSTP
jgi:hypothetical protein